MIVTFYMCASLLGSLPCVPFATGEACNTAINGLDLRLVEQSECARVETLLYISPDTSPLPPRKP